MENNELRRDLIRMVVEEWINKNLFSSRDTNMEKSLIEHINQYLKIENLLLTFEKDEQEQNIIMVRYGNTSKQYQLIFTLSVILIDDGYSESGISSGTTGYMRDEKYPQ